MCRPRPRPHDRVMLPNTSPHTPGTTPAFPRRLHGVPATQAPWPVRVVGSELLMPSWLNRKASASRASHTS
jgi:hypothetical protein